jgi:hypothetical protein
MLQAREAEASGFRLALLLCSTCVAVNSRCQGQILLDHVWAILAAVLAPKKTTLDAVQCGATGSCAMMTTINLWYIRDLSSSSPAALLLHKASSNSLTDRSEHWF